MGLYHVARAVSFLNNDCGLVSSASTCISHQGHCHPDSEQ